MTTQSTWSDEQVAEATEMLGRQLTAARMRGQNEVFDALADYLLTARTEFSKVIDKYGVDADVVQAVKGARQLATELTNWIDECKKDGF